MLIFLFTLVVLLLIKILGNEEDAGLPGGPPYNSSEFMNKELRVFG